MSHFRVGLIGSGGIAQVHAAAAEASGGSVSVAAVVDPDGAARAALGERLGVPGFGSVEALLADGVARELDGVLVCTPPSVRVAIAEQALGRGLAVLMEKPLAHTVADAERLATLAEQHQDVAFAAGYCHRWVPAVQEIRRRLSAGELGDPVRFENVFACWHPGVRGHWMSDPGVSGGGALLDTGSHSFDLFQHLLGPMEVAGVVLRSGWAGRGETNATVLVEAAASEGPAVAGVIASGWAEPPRFTLTLVGTRGSLHYDYARPEHLIWQRQEGPSETVPVQTHETRFIRQLQAFAAWARDPSQPTDLARPDEALAVARAVAAAQQQAGHLEPAPARP